jgi:hypothetical protein
LKKEAIHSILKMLLIKNVRPTLSTPLTKTFRSCGLFKYFLPGILFSISLLSTESTSGQSSRRNTHKQATYRIKKSFKKFSYKSLGMSINSLNYFGDLAPAPKRISTDLSQTRPAYALTFEHRKGPRFSYRAAFTYGTIRGSDARLANDVEAALAKDNFTESYYRYRRNASFKNHIKELSVTFVFDFIENNNFFFRRPIIAPYIFSGIALFHHNPKAKIPARDVQGNTLPGAGEWIELQPLGTEGQHAKLLETDANFGIRTYRLLQPSIPIGFGARLKYTNQINFFCELSFRYLFTDYVDDVSKNYVDLGVFDNEVARTLSYRGNDIPNIRPQTYTGRDGKTYTVEAGFGAEHSSNVRGNKNDNDMLFLITIGGAVILEPHRRAKFR